MCIVREKLCIHSPLPSTLPSPPLFGPHPLSIPTPIPPLTLLPLDFGTAQPEGFKESLLTFTLTIQPGAVSIAPTGNIAAFFTGHCLVAATNYKCCNKIELNSVIGYLFKLDFNTFTLTIMQATVSVT